MPRYTSRPRPIAWDDEDGIAPSFMPCLTVDDAEPAYTGLLDHRGDPLFRMPEPIGFHHPLNDSLR